MCIYYLDLPVSERLEFFTYILSFKWHSFECILFFYRQLLIFFLQCNFKSVSFTALNNYKFKTIKLKVPHYVKGSELYICSVCFTKNIFVKLAEG